MLFGRNIQAQSLPLRGEHRAPQSSLGAGRRDGVLTVGVLMGQPVVLGVLKLKVRVPLLALLCSEVLEVLLALLRVTKLVLKVDAGAVLTAVDGPAGETALQKLLGGHRSTATTRAVLGSHQGTAPGTQRFCLLWSLPAGAPLFLSRQTT